jgi:hypothetical protein
MSDAMKKYQPKWRIVHWMHTTGYHEEILTTDLEKSGI